jgi:hypothetical protein
MEHPVFFQAKADLQIAVNLLDYLERVLSVACGKTPKSAVAEFLRENVAPS